MALHGRSRSTQQGLALLVVLLIGMLAGATLFLAAANGSQWQRQREIKTQQALAQAKEALIAWSVNNALPGRMPCPEDVTLIGTPNEGNQGNCSNTSISVGRLPWRTLGLPQLTDADGEPLWYVLSPGFRQAPINSESLGQIQIDATPPLAIALIISPGAPLAGQLRTVVTAATPPNPAQYLDGTNNNGDLLFTAVAVAGSMNDSVLPVYPSNLMPALEKRVAGEVRAALRQYYCGFGNVDGNGNCITLTDPNYKGFFPRPAAFTDNTCLGASLPPPAATACSSAAIGNEGRIPANPATPWSPTSLFQTTTWFQANCWRELVYYAVAPPCIDGTLNCTGAGSFLLEQASGKSARVVVITAGSNLNVTPRNPLLVSNYFEDQNASTGDNTFTQWPSITGTAFNDTLLIIPQ